MTTSAPSSKNVLSLNALRELYLPVVEILSKSSGLQGAQKAILKNALANLSWDARILWDIYNLAMSLENKLIEADYDPDLLPEPPKRIIDLIPNEASPSTPTVSITVMDPDEDVVLALKLIPGILGSPASHLWRTNAALELVVTLLRDLVAKHNVIVTEEAVAYLKTAKKVATATTIPSIGILSLGEKGRVQIRFHKAEPNVEDQLKRVSGLRWDGIETKAFLAPASKLKELAAIAKQYNIALDVNAQAALDTHLAPLKYDGTFDGLRGVPITDLVCVDTAKAKRLAEFGIASVWDLLNLIPRRYLDRSTPTMIRDLKVDEEVGLLAKITNINVDQRRRMLRISLSDGSGKIDLVYFNAVWQAKRFRVGDSVVAYGKVTEWVSNTGRSVLSLSNPMLDPLGESTLPVIPIYPQSAKSRVTTSDIHFAVAETLARLAELVDSVPQSVRDNLDLMPRTDALRAVHLPTSLSNAEKGRRRLAFDELFRMQLALLSLKAQEEQELGITHNPTGELTGALLAGLPFELTNAQKKVYSEIREDLIKPAPMHRMIQGDVGSGKSALAYLTLLSGVEGGYQGALMAPTGILAKQLYEELAERTSGMHDIYGNPLRVEYFSNELKGKKRKEILKDLAEGNIHLAVGTHALLVADVIFKNLGIIVVDELHRFGVSQRATLRDKGPTVIINGEEKKIKNDVIIQSATPIPRTMALTFFGDLDVSILDELPPNRTPIKTHWLDSEIDLINPKFEAWEKIRSEVTMGRQAFVVCALVEDNDKLELASAMQTFEDLSNGALEGLRTGLVYGQQPAIEKEETMRAFKDGELDVLIATTVIETGVNIPNASVIAILDCSRFGVAQLHQLRGRVGRGKYSSECFLIGKCTSATARTRMEALVASTDGFYLSEVDLENRSHGSLFGEAQSGASDLQVADLFLDKELIILAHEAALEIIEDDPRLERRPGLRNEVKNMLGEGAEEWLVKS